MMDVYIVLQQLDPSISSFIEAGKFNLTASLWKEFIEKVIYNKKFIERCENIFKKYVDTFNHDVMLMKKGEFYKFIGDCSVHRKHIFYRNDLFKLFIQKKNMMNFNEFVKCVALLDVSTPMDLGKPSGCLRLALIFSFYSKSSKILNSSNMSLLLSDLNSMKHPKVKLTAAATAADFIDLANRNHTTLVDLYDFVLNEKLRGTSQILRIDIDKKKFTLDSKNLTGNLCYFSTSSSFALNSCSSLIPFSCSPIPPCFSLSSGSCIPLSSGSCIPLSSGSCIPLSSGSCSFLSSSYCSSLTSGYCSSLTSGYCSHLTYDSCSSLSCCSLRPFFSSCSSVISFCSISSLSCTSMNAFLKQENEKSAILLKEKPNANYSSEKGLKKHNEEEIKLEKVRNENIEKSIHFKSITGEEARRENSKVNISIKSNELDSNNHLKIKDCIIETVPLEEKRTWQRLTKWITGVMLASNGNGMTRKKNVIEKGNQIKKKQYFAAYWKVLPVQSEKNLQTKKELVNATRQIKDLKTKTMKILQSKERDKLVDSTRKTNILEINKEGGDQKKRETNRTNLKQLKKKFFKSFSSKFYNDGVIKDN